MTTPTQTKALGSNEDTSKQLAYLLIANSTHFTSKKKALTVQYLYLYLSVFYLFDYTFYLTYCVPYILYIYLIHFIL